MTGPRPRAWRPVTLEIEGRRFEADMISMGEPVLYEMRFGQRRRVGREEAKRLLLQRAEANGLREDGGREEGESEVGCRGTGAEGTSGSGDHRATAPGATGTADSGRDRS